MFQSFSCMLASNPCSQVVRQSLLPHHDTLVLRGFKQHEILLRIGHEKIRKVVIFVTWKKTGVVWAPTPGGMGTPGWYGHTSLDTTMNLFLAFENCYRSYTM